MGIHKIAGRLAGAFRRDRRGAIAPIFAVLAGTLVTLVGVGIDVSRIASARTALQDATDAAGLALSREASTNQGDPMLQTKAKAWVTANINPNDFLPDTLVVTPDTSTKNAIKITATAQVQPSLSAVFHLGPFNVAANSTVNYEVQHVEVALVLDNTGSMGQSLDGTQTKIQVLKQAAKKLIDTLMTPANAGGVKMGVVPYAEYVNVGMANRNAAWMSVAPDTSTSVPDKGAKKTCTTRTSNQCTGGVYSNNCGTTTTYKDGVPSTSTYGCYTTPQTCKSVTTTVAPYECGNFVAGHTDTSKWFGCAKYQLLGFNLALPDPATPYVGIMETTANSRFCLSEILPLNGSNATVSTTVAGLITSRTGYTDPSTYVPGGLHWGINLLSPPSPFSEGEAYDADNKMPRKALILMTDGSNTKFLQQSTPGLLNPTATNSTPSAAQLVPTYLDQDRMCDYAKSKHIEIYTIGFGVDDATALAHLKSCATPDKPGEQHYFPATDSSGLLNAFKVIAGSLSKLRIAA